MKDLALDSSHDLELSDCDLSFVENGYETVQSAKIRILTILNEYFLDYTLGLPWFDKMFSMYYSHIQKMDLIKKTILETDGVRKIVSFEFGMDLINQGVLIQMQVETIYGIVNSEVRV